MWLFSFVIPDASHIFKWSGYKSSGKLAQIINSIITAFITFMTQSNSFSASFTLDKAHYSECYSQSSTLSHDKNTYFKANILTVFGLIILLATPVNPYAAWFVIALGILESVSVYYHKPWWVMRQMLSKASGSKVQLTIDEQGVLTESFHTNNRILWADVTLVTETELGFIVYFSLGKSITGKAIASKSYLSKSCLSDECAAFIKAQSSIATETIES